MNILSQPFVKATLDPNLIRGIYNTCDQWCVYCPATARCLAYQCRPRCAREEAPQDIYANIADRMFEAQRDTIQAMAERYAELLAAIVERPDARLPELLAMVPTGGGRECARHAVL